MARDVTNIHRDFIMTQTYILDPPDHPRPSWLADSHQVTGCIVKDSQRGDIVTSNFKVPTTYGCHRLSRTPKSFDVSEKFWTRSYHQGWFYYKKRIYGIKAPSTNVGSLDINPFDVRFPPHHSKAATSICLRKLLDSDVDLGEALSEVRSNAGLIANTLLNVADMYRVLRNKHKADVNQILTRRRSVDELGDEAANAYLTFMFGVKPLAETIVGAWDAIQKAFDSSDLAVSVVGESSSSGPPELGVDSLVYTYDGEKTVGAKVGVTYQVTDPAKHALAALRISNPLTAAWAALPLSFVIDWFVHVGSVLNGLTAPIGLQFNHGYETRFSYGNYTAKEDAWSFWKKFGGTFPSCEVDINAFSRINLSGFPKPSIYFTLNLGSGQIVTALALLKQRG